MIGVVYSVLKTACFWSLESSVLFGEIELTCEWRIETL